MSAAALKQLRDAGVLREVDRALGDLVLRRHPEAAPEVRDAVALAAALASRSVVAGHSGLRLDDPASTLDALPAGELDAVADAGLLMAELAPDADAWAARLRQSPWVSDGPGTTALLCLQGELLQLRRYAVYEQGVAEALLLRASSTGLAVDVVAGVMSSRFEKADEHDARQRAAAAIALSSRLLILCGGPGTGKTHTVLRLLDALVAADPSVKRIHLAAPTGKAASRLDDSLRQRLPAIDRDGRITAALAGAGNMGSTQTLHRLLGLRPDGSSPRHHAGRPLPTDLLVVDEVSMVDLPLMARLLDALSPGARLLLVGDHNQLASVETGDVLSALDSAAAGGGPLSGHRVTLQHNHRFGAGSAIGRLADAVCVGDVAAARALLDSEAALRLEGSSVGHVLSSLSARVATLHAGLQAAASPEQALSLMDDYRVLCALRRGPLGADAINRRLDAGLASKAARLGSTHYPGQLLLIRENQPRLGLANGDTGVVLAAADDRLEAWFRDAQGQPRALPLALLPAHQPGWALSVHQAQGSEYEHVDVVLGEMGSRVLGRQLLYTAVTRARQTLAVMAGPGVLDAAISRRLMRVSGLSWRLATSGDDAG